MPNRNAHSTPAKPPKLEAQGHQKNIAINTIDKSVKTPVQSMFGKGSAK